MVMILHVLILFMNIMKMDMAEGHTIKRRACALLFLALFILKPETSYTGTITLNIRFDTNEYIVKDIHFGELARFAHVLKNYPDLEVTLEGHTDNVGDAGSNLELSRKRAGSVKDHLVSLGIDASRIAVKGHGESRPVADNGTEQGKWRNRRVEATGEYERAVFLRKKAKNSVPAFPPSSL